MLSNRYDVLRILFILFIAASLAGCGLYEEIPGIRTGDVTPDDDGQTACEEAVDCDAPANMTASCVQNRCVYVCRDDYSDLDGDPASNGCECRIEAEICDGADNDCDGVKDNLFEGGQIAVGGAHSCAMTANGEIFCWGNNAHGQLGVDAGAAQPRPTHLIDSDALNASDIALGARHSCILSEDDGAVYCWGANDKEQVSATLGNADYHAPIALDSPSAFKSITAGAEFSCALTRSGQAHCWGDNTFGQLGAIPGEPVANPSAFATIDAGAGHVCGLDEAGQAYCWGDNGNRQVGSGDDTAEYLEPVEVASAQAFADISAGGGISCAQIADTTGEFYCWGSGRHDIWLLDPANVGYAIVELAAGDGLICGLGAEGDLQCGGMGGGTVHYETFAGYQFVDIAVGAGHRCALTRDGRVYCWGANTDGQIGNGLIGGIVPRPQQAICN
jgi:alpha-tubulin suppressor-like RCC1 family protein